MPAGLYVARRGTMQIAAPGGGAFTPASLSPTVWLKDSGLSGVDGDPIGTWTNSGSSGNYTQATSSKRPTLKTNILDGFPVARLDAVDDGMVGSYSRAAGEPFTVWAVYAYKKFLAADGARRLVAGSNNWLMGPYNAQHNAYSGSGFLSTPPAASVGVFVAFCVTQDTPNAATGYLNNVSFGTAASSAAPGTFHLGTEGVFAELADSDLAELVIVSGVASGTDRTNMQTYFDARFPSL